mmetsp:Transcript_62649/g.117198  ORF Transcript_62649/g.117198 Transcript_62649/m.117198 type:complete len:111 (-) Transcript_62649:3-335(-)
MVECHAALIGAVMGGLGPILSNGLGRATGFSPDCTGTGRSIPRQPAGVIALFGALGSATAAAMAAMSSGSLGLGAFTGLVVSGSITGVSATDMLKRRNLLGTQPGLHPES